MPIWKRYNSRSIKGIKSENDPVQVLVHMADWTHRNKTIVKLVNDLFSSINEVYKISSSIQN